MADQKFNAPGDAPIDAAALAITKGEQTNRITMFLDRIGYPMSACPGLVETIFDQFAELGPNGCKNSLVVDLGLTDHQAYEVVVILSGADEIDPLATAPGYREHVGGDDEEV